MLEKMSAAADIYLPVNMYVAWQCPGNCLDTRWHLRHDKTDKSSQWVPATNSSPMSPREAVEIDMVAELRAANEYQAVLMPNL